jgi:hypothetical protein
VEGGLLIYSFPTPKGILCNIPDDLPEIIRHGSQDSCVRLLGDVFSLRKCFLTL